MIVEIFLHGKLVLQALLLTLNFETHELHMDRGTTVDDLYNGMRIEVAGKNIGCVHDYDSRIKTITFGRCFGPHEPVEANVDSVLVCLDDGECVLEVNP